MVNRTSRKGTSRPTVRGTDFLVRGLDPIPSGLEGESAHEALSALLRARNVLRKRGHALNTRDRNQLAKAVVFALENISGHLWLPGRRPTDGSTWKL